RVAEIDGALLAIDGAAGAVEGTQEALLLDVEAGLLARGPGIDGAVENVQRRGVGALPAQERLRAQLHALVRRDHGAIVRRRAPRKQGHMRRASDSAKSPAASVHHWVSAKPAADSSCSTRSRRNFALISVRSSSPPSNVTSRSRAPMRTVCATSARSRISIHSSSSFQRATWVKRFGSKSPSSARLMTARTFLLNSAVTPASSS